jgi:copper(I)-binding protein
MIRRPCIAALLLSCAAAAQAAEPRGHLDVSASWARPTAPGISVGVVYFAVHNSGSTADRLIAAASPVAGKAELHETRTVDGMMQMRAVDGVQIPAGATIRSEPGGLHLMLTGLKQPLRSGSSFALTLRFRDAGPVTIQVPVKESP